MFLYVIKLESEKCLLHCSNRYEIEKPKILLECELQYNYANIYKPIDILESTPIRQNNEIDFYVKKFMHYYGIDNVRGGCYIEENINNNTRNQIMNEFETTLEKYEIQNNEIQNILMEYKDIDNWSLHQIQEELSNIESIKTKYNNEKSMLQNLKYGNTNIEINRTFLPDLLWLNNQISKIANNLEFDNKSKQMYVKIVNKMKVLYKIFINYTDIDDTYSPKIHLYQPCSILDNVFYHNKNIKDWLNEYSILDKFLNYYEYIYYCVINRIDEYTFDVKTYPSNIENINKYKEKYLRKFLQKYNNIFTRDHDGKGLSILGQS